MYHLIYTYTIFATDWEFQIEMSFSHVTMEFNLFLLRYWMVCHIGYFYLYSKTKQQIVLFKLVTHKTAHICVGSFRSQLYYIAL